MRNTIKVNTIIRGIIIGAIISMTMAIPAGLDGLKLIAFGIAYGAITDVIATKLAP